jgi:hypothetical protein
VSAAEWFKSNISMYLEPDRAVIRCRAVVGIAGAGNVDATGRLTTSKPIEPVKS